VQLIGSPISRDFRSDLLFFNEFHRREITQGIVRSLLVVILVAMLRFSVSRLL